MNAAAQRAAAADQERQELKRAKQREANKRFREKVRSDPELMEKDREKRREWRKQYREKHKDDPVHEAKRKEKQQRAKERKQEKEKAAQEEYISEPSTQAALINSKHGYSVVIAEHHQKLKHVIVERFGENYRLKITEYHCFRSMDGVRSWARENNIRLNESSDYFNAPMIDQN